MPVYFYSLELLCLAFSYCAKSDKVSLVFIFIWISNIHCLSQIIETAPPPLNYRWHVAKCRARFKCLPDISVRNVCLSRSPGPFWSLIRASYSCLTCFCKRGTTDIDIPNGNIFFKCTGSCYIWDPMLCFSKLNHQASQLQVTENSAQQTQAEMELIGSPVCWGAQEHCLQAWMDAGTQILPSGPSSFHLSAQFSSIFASLIWALSFWSQDSCHHLGLTFLKLQV